MEEERGPRGGAPPDEPNIEDQVSRVQAKGRMGRPLPWGGILPFPAAHPPCVAARKEGERTQGALQHARSGTQRHRVGVRDSGGQRLEHETVTGKGLAGVAYLDPVVLWACSRRNCVGTCGWRWGRQHPCKEQSFVKKRSLLFFYTATSRAT